MRPRDLIAALVGAAVVLVLAGSVAWAAIPGSSGVIQGCYDSGGNVKVVEALPCPRSYTPFQWNQQGAPGLPGANGTNGTNGTDGISPQVTPLPAGDVNCPSGGAALTDADGTTAYICSGEDGAEGEPGPQGERGLQGPPGAAGSNHANQHCAQTSSLFGQSYVWGFDGGGGLICITDKQYN